MMLLDYQHNTEKQTIITTSPNNIFISGIVVMSNTGSSNPSNYDLAFSVLTSRLIKWEGCKFEKPNALEEWQKFATICGLPAQTTFESLSSFRNVLSTDHANEAAFDQELFKVLRNAIGKDNIDTQKSNNNRIVLKVEKSE
jgi:hypothetical protein